MSLKATNVCSDLMRLLKEMVLTRSFDDQKVVMSIGFRYIDRKPERICSCKTLELQTYLCTFMSL